MEVTPEMQAEVLRIMDEVLLPSPEFWVKELDHDVRGGRDCYCLRGARLRAIKLVLEQMPDGSPYDMAHTLSHATSRVVQGCIQSDFGAEERPTWSETAFNDTGETTFEDVKQVIACAREKVTT